MESIKDLFNKTRYVSNGNVLSERASLVQYFADEMRKEPRVIAIRLGHYKEMKDLYYLKSSFKDRQNKNADTAKKWFWYITRTGKLSTFID